MFYFFTGLASVYPSPPYPLDSRVGCALLAPVQLLLYTLYKLNTFQVCVSSLLCTTRYRWRTHVRAYIITYKYRDGECRGALEKKEKKEGEKMARSNYLVGINRKASVRLRFRGRKRRIFSGRCVYHITN